MSEFLENLEEDAVGSSDTNGGVKETMTKENLTECLVEAVKTVAKWKNIDSSRLKRQVSVCMNIIHGMLDGKKNFIVAAPTGFGKTILGLMATEMFKNASERGLIDCSSDSYILTPNIFLQNQYQEDIKKFELSKTHAQLKGQSNYPCIKDYTKNFATRPCSKIAVSKLTERIECGKLCPYVNARNHAIQSSTTVFNYNYFLTAMNFTYEQLEDFAPFAPRGLAIFDEVHTIASIVDDMFKTELDLHSISNEIYSHASLVDTLYGGSAIYDGDFTKEDKENVEGIIASLKNRHDVLIKYTNQAKSMKTVDVFNNILVEITDTKNDLDTVNKIYSKIIAKNFPTDDDKKEPSDDQQSILKHFSKLDALCLQLIMLIKMYNEVGVETMVADIDKRTEKGVENTYVSFRCVKSDALIRQHVMKYTNYSIMMSATIGYSETELNSFATTHGIDNNHNISVASDFDFEESPILFVTPQLKMSYKEKEQNMPKMLERIKTIVLHNPKHSGIIHTGNYQFLEILKSYIQSNNMGDRFLWCMNAKQKTENVNQIKWDIEHNGWSNRVLVGASLLEGVDLKDDLSRFSIFMKVPFPSLADELVKRRMNLYDNWYNTQTMTAFLQGIGRGNRHKNDWCKIYLLDGSYKGFFWRYGTLPSIISKRLKFVTLQQWFGNRELPQHTPPPNSPPIPIVDEIEQAKDIASDLKPNNIFGDINEQNELGDSII